MLDPLFIFFSCHSRVKMADTLSIVALVVSLVALVIAVAQALQQHISIAEGLRKCQESVIGNWYHLTRRKF
jgi:hypothetical protein